MLLAATLAACQPGQGWLTGLSPGDPAAMSTEKLCLADEGGQGSQAIERELLRRGALTAAELPALHQGHLRPGMSRCAVLALYGEPVEVNRTGIGETLGYTAHFITLENGRVVEISK